MPDRYSRMSGDTSSQRRADSTCRTAWPARMPPTGCASGGTPQSRRTSLNSSSTSSRRSAAPSIRSRASRSETSPTGSRLKAVRSVMRGGIGSAGICDVTCSSMTRDAPQTRMPALPIPPRITLRTAFTRLPVGLVSDLDARLRMLGAADRLDEVLEEFKQVRLDCGVPPLAQPVGGILAGQAVRHVLSARRWDEVSPDMREYLSGIYGNPPQAIAPAAAAHADPNAAVDPSPDLDQMRAEGLAASEEDLLLIALFGDDASRLLATLRGRGDREDAERDGLERSQSQRIRELIEMVEGSDVGELTVEDAGVRITVRRQDERPLAPVAAAQTVAPADNGAAESAAPSVSQTVTVPSPMVGTFYRSPSPTAEPFVSEGDTVAVDQVLCVLEAMKLFNELKSEHAGVIRAVLVGNAEPVEYGQPLFELELV